MNRFLLLFTFLWCNLFYCQAQKKAEFFLEYSPHFSHTFNLENYKTFKFSYAISLHAALKISEHVSFIPGISFLNTGAKNKMYSDIRTIGINYGVVSLGTKLQPNKFYILPEFGLAVFLNQIVTNYEDEQTRRIIYNSRELAYRTNASKLSLLTGMTVGYEIEKFKKTWNVGIRSYFILSTSSGTSFEKVVHPHGIGLNLGVKL